MSNSGSSSHTQTSPAWVRSTSTSCTRIGSDNAFATAAMRAAPAGSTSGSTTGSQQRSPAARLRLGASVISTDMNGTLPHSSDDDALADSADAPQSGEHPRSE